MSKENQQTANLLGAAVLALHDELRLAVESFTGRTGESSAALVVLGHQPGLSNDQLTQLLNLTHTGTVRLIDRLAEDGLVERRKGVHDKRAIALFLTEQGHNARKEILSAREDRMLSVMAGLSQNETKALNTILAKILLKASPDDLQKLRNCRLCDADACPDCPIYVAV